MPNSFRISYRLYKLIYLVIYTNVIEHFPWIEYFTEHKMKMKLHLTAVKYPLWNMKDE